MKKNLTPNPTTLKVFLLLLFPLGLSHCKKEDVNITERGFEQRESNFSSIKMSTLMATGITSNSYYLEDALPEGYVKNGSRDYTSYLQAAINKYSNVVFPSFPILVNDRGLLIGSNKTLTFLPGSEIRLKATSDDKYTILNISAASNVTLYNPVVVGDRNNHIGTTGEHGIGIGIRGSNNVSVYSPKVTDCWGDGIYVGQFNSSTNCKNILIKDAYLRKNRRDGIGIIAVDGLLLDNIYAGYTDGTTPMSGINFEPNSSTCEIKNVRVNNPRTEYNGANGIQIGTRKMLGASRIQTDITIVNHIDIGSPKYAFKLTCVSLDGSVDKLKGTVNVVNPSWKRSGTKRPLVLNTNQVNFKLFVSSPEVSVQDGPVLSWTDTYNMLMKETRTGTISVSDKDENTSDAGSPGAIIFAVNAGGSSYTASNGITYGADKNYKNGNVFTTDNPISNTADATLYQSERFGNFSYSIPVSEGSYEITLKFAEIYQQDKAGRQFDVIAEDNVILSNLDIYASAGFNRAYDVVKTVSVTDGILNIDFHTDIDNAKLSALHVRKK